MRLIGLSRPLTAGRAAPWTVFGLATAFWLVFLTLFAHGLYSGDPLGLLCVSEKRALPAVMGDVPRAGPSGYDGQFYAILATDPWLRDPATAGFLDNPTYRATRVLFPAVGWLLAGGDAGTAPRVYQLVVWALGLALILLVALWLREAGGSALWAAPLAVGAGLVAAQVRSLTDAAAVALIVAALWAHQRGKLAVSLTLLSLAVLGRETSLLAAAAVAFVELRSRRPVRAALFAAVPLLPLVAWKGYLWTLFHVSAGVLYVFDVPFAWVPEKAAQMTAGAAFDRVEALGMLAVLASFAAAAVLLARPGAWSAVEVTVLGFAALAFVVDLAVYCERWAYARHLLAIPVLAVVVAERLEPGWRRWVVRAPMLVFALLGLMMLHGLARNASIPVGAMRALLAPKARVASTALHPVAAGATFYVMPVASTPGMGGSLWRTDLELRDLSGAPNRVAVELLPKGDQGGRVLQASLTVGAFERKRIEDAVLVLFDFRGAGAMRVVAERRLEVAARTYDAAAPARAARLLPVLFARDAVLAGGKAWLVGLTSADDPAELCRTNLGLLNLSGRWIEVETELFDEAGRLAGRTILDVPRGGFAQFDDVLRRAGQPAARNWTARLRPVTPGSAVLAYAAVIDGPGAEVRYVFPTAAPGPLPRQAAIHPPGVRP